MGEIDLFPLQLSFQVAASATLLGILIAFPIAWLLSRAKNVWFDAMDSAFMLPMVLPPTVLGYYLLVLVGRNSPLGQVFESLGLPLVFTVRGAVIAATVASVPFFIKTAGAAMESVPKELIESARVLGENEVRILLLVILPMAWRGIASGIILMFARALGDFGTTLMVSGSIPHATTTMPIAIYDAMLAGENVKAN